MIRPYAELVFLLLLNQQQSGFSPNNDVRRIVSTSSELSLEKYLYIGCKIISTDVAFVRTRMEVCRIRY